MFDIRRQMTYSCLHNLYMEGSTMDTHIFLGIIIMTVVLGYRSVPSL